MASVVLGLRARGWRALAVPLLLAVALPVTVVWARTALDRVTETAVDGDGIFTDVTEVAGIDAGHALERDGTGEDARFAPWNYVGTGQAWGDYDNDGWLDLYVTDQTGPNTLYRNQGDGSFAPAPAGDPADLADDTSGGAVFVDVDNDGWRDLYVAGSSGGSLLRNDGGTRFIDITESAGIRSGDPAIMGAWADYDGDGLLDLFVATNECFSCRAEEPGQGGRNQLFHNLGDGRFEDVTDLIESPDNHAFTMVAGWVDVDDDGDQDLYVANDSRAQRFLPKNVLLRNDGAGCGGWCFSDISEAGAGVRRGSMGLAVGDYDRDGGLDLFVTSVGYRNPVSGPSVLLRNTAEGTFTDTDTAIIDAFGWGTTFVDVDNDG